MEWGHQGPWILGELRIYLLCFQFKCKCWEFEHLEKVQRHREKGGSRAVYIQ